MTDPPQNPIGSVFEGSGWDAIARFKAVLRPTCRAASIAATATAVCGQPRMRRSATSATLMRKEAHLMRDDLQRRPHRHVLVPTTPLGTWGVGLSAAAAGLFVALVTVVPGDSLVARFAAVSSVALAIAAVIALYAGARHGERAASVWAAAAVLGGGVLFLLLHSLFISD